MCVEEKKTDSSSTFFRNRFFDNTDHYLRKIIPNTILLTEFLGFFS